MVYSPDNNGIQIPEVGDHVRYWEGAVLIEDGLVTHAERYSGYTNYWFGGADPGSEDALFNINHSTGSPNTTYSRNGRWSFVVRDNRPKVGDRVRIVDPDHRTPIRVGDVGSIIVDDRTSLPFLVHLDRLDDDYWFRFGDVEVIGAESSSRTWMPPVAPPSSVKRVKGLNAPYSHFVRDDFVSDMWVKEGVPGAVKRSFVELVSECGGVTEVQTTPYDDAVAFFASCTDPLNHGLRTDVSKRHARALIAHALDLPVEGA